MLNELSVFAGGAIAICGGAIWGGLCLGPQAFKQANIRSLRRICQGTRSLVLTFDDGPATELTPQVLDLLADSNAKATFFLVGSKVPSHEAIVQRTFEEGHEIGSHSQDHLHAWKTLPWTANADVRNGFETVRPWTAPNAPFRPPWGKLTLHTWLAARHRGSPVAWWTIDSGDTFDTMPEPQIIADSVARTSGGVVLLHDSDRPVRRKERADYVLSVTRLLLQTAKAEGLNVCTYRDLLIKADEFHQHRPNPQSMHAPGLDRM